MIAGTLIIAGSTIYLSRLLGKYVGVTERLAEKRAMEISESEEAAKAWTNNRPRRAAPVDRGIRGLRELLEVRDEASAEEASEQVLEEYSV